MAELIVLAILGVGFVVFLRLAQSLLRGGPGRIAALEDENRRLREELDRRRDG